MIQNDLQLKNSEGWLKRLREALEKMKQEYTDPQELAVFTQGVREQIEQIEIEITEYVKHACSSPGTSNRIWRVSMDYQIALSPDLNLTPADFIAAWNEEPECRAVAEARLAKPASAQYDLLSVGVAALGSVAAGVATNALYDLIKRIVVKKGVTKQTEFVALDLPDGSHLIVVKIIEEE